jgi:calcineurin-like phosphoesterase family protein
LRPKLVVLTVVAFLAALLGFTPGAYADSLTFNVAEDTYTSQSNASATHGTNTYLGNNATPGERRAYLKFSVSGLSGDATDIHATVNIYAQAASTANFTVWSVPSTWTEAGLAWNNQPALGAALTTLNGVAVKWNSIDLSSYITGNGTYAFAITTTSSTEIRFTSKESTSNNRATVKMTWTAPTTTITEPTTTSSTTSSTTPPTTSSTTSTTVLSSDPVLGAVGDIACAPGSTVTRYACQQAATAALLAGNDVTIVQTLGDNQYESGTDDEFAFGYDPAWGALKYKTNPAPGNHEYLTIGATGYYNYFGVEAGDPTKGYYSYDLGSWHIVVLNGEISSSAGSVQELWFRSDLTSHPNQCTIAVWHEPLFSSTVGGAKKALFTDAYNYGLDFVLNGHAHNYERFAPQNANGVADPVNGVREFVVGTGGKDHHKWTVTYAANSEAHNNTDFGVLKLTLHSGSYDWKFVPIGTSTYTDSGTGYCH